MSDQVKTIRKVWLDEIKHVILSGEYSEQILQEAWKRAMHASWLSYGPCSCQDKSFDMKCFLERTHDEMETTFPPSCNMSYEQFKRVFDMVIQTLDAFLSPTTQA